MRHRSSIATHLAAGGSLLAVALLLTACDQPAAQGSTPPAQPPQQKAATPPGPAPAATPPPPVVTVSKPAARDIVEWDEYTGRFDAIDTVEIRARVSGYLLDVHFKDGQLVKQGDLLFVVDARPFQGILDQANAELTLARTRVENSSRDVERGRPLVDRKIMSEKVFDDRENAKRDAEAQVKVAEARVKLAELDVAFTRVHAPAAGRIGRGLVSRGNYVVGGGASSPTLLTTLVSQDPIHIYFDINENNWLKYRRLAGRAGAAGATLGTPVLVALPDESDFPHKGILDFIDNRLDQGTGTLRARAEMANKSGLFAPGMFARVRLAGSAAKTAMLVPDAAIGTDQAAKFVMVVAEDGTAQRRVVTLGPLAEGLRIVRTGLAAEDWVVVNGLQRARSGAKVTPKREPIKLTDVAPGPGTSVSPAKASQ